MMLKVTVYAYTQKIYSSRRIAKALRENTHFMWLSVNNQPDFRTINRFRSTVMKEVIDEVFAAVLEVFKRFMLRGTEKVKTEWGLLCIAHNIAKMAVVPL
jgi:transposase